MEEIQNQLETLIDDIERDETMTNSDIVLALYKLKEEAEKIFKENDMFSRIDAYVNAYYKIIDDLD